MGIFDKFLSKRIDEAIAAFQNKGVSQASKGDPGGEGIEDLSMLDQGYGQIGTLSLNRFYNRYINKIYQNEYQKIIEYRRISESPEISDVIEDAVNEATQMDETDTGVFQLSIRDEKLESNENIKNILYKEFTELFHNRINIDNKIWDYFRSYLIDGRLYYERILSSNKKEGIKNIKKLPAETIDMEYDLMTGKIQVFYQYLSPNIKRPFNRQIAEQDKGKIIVFEPAQIGFINYGVYGTSRYDMYGYLEKAKVPYNQLKLLETSVIIYRIVRSPERFVFKIDTGQMPRDKAMRFVEKVKTKFIKKQSYDPTTGKLSAEPEVLCLDLNTEIQTVEHGSLKLSNIIDKFDNGEKLHTYSVNETNDQVETEIEWAGVTKKNTEVIRIHLENGKYIDCTPEHKFLVWKDELKTEIINVEAQNLTEEMDLVENV